MVRAVVRAVVAQRRGMCSVPAVFAESIEVRAEVRVASSKAEEPSSVVRLRHLPLQPSVSVAFLHDLVT